MTSCFPCHIPAVVILCLLSAAQTHGTSDAPAADPTLPVPRGMIERFAADQALVNRFHDAPGSSTARNRSSEFLQNWLDQLHHVDFDQLDADGRIDYLLFQNHLRASLRELEYAAQRELEMAPLLPFASAITDLHEARRQLEPVDAAAVADRLTELAALVNNIAETVRSGGIEAKATVANRAVRRVSALRRTLRNWHAFHASYDPMFTWWIDTPYGTLDTALETYAETVSETLVGVGTEDTRAIIGDPIGREALIDRLGFEMIPYTPEELVAIAESEYAWCRREMLRAANELGYGDDWHAALDYVKTLHVEPGQQPALIRDLAHEAIDFLEQRDLLTIPELCRDSWRMEMMSPERQLVSPYFLGGEVIIVSYPTDGMSHESKMMSMRGNNIHFSRATVQHELIPGHHLQGFMTERYRTHRRLFRTPFWIEGWALYWEMLLWDLGFPQSPENRVGMLFWRSHRCARIIFSLNFHLEQMTPEECIDFLVENVGHERNNATAEVRRSVSGDYGPLYQAAYMLGGLQIRAMYRELVETGRMPARVFHDTILQQNAIPIELIRARMTDQKIDPDFTSTWRFYDDVP